MGGGTACAMVRLFPFGQHFQSGGTHTARQYISMVDIGLYGWQKDVEIVFGRTVTDGAEIY
jgi:hypothetical protein